MLWLLVPAAYLIGGIPFGLLIAHRHGIDIRTVGSGNIGATNVWRACGWRAGLPALLADILKGTLPCLLAVSAGPPQTGLQIAVAAAAILGHSFSPFIGFKGGKAVATSLGAAFALVPWAALAALLTFLTTVALTRYVSVGSLLGALALGLGTQLGAAPAGLKVLVWLVVILVWVRHRANLGRLLRGEEHRFTLGGRSLPTPPAEDA
ncbi:MAG: glycerol-3-phosphate 1-O-acyltransferase PlsY [Fimbriimonadaceae bacterium]|nr:glycerol-3-phosphate 1-O-acyltransferase PlsY [Fimbriimonadaceae bacterium]